jgi:hypothetical protein
MSVIRWIDLNKVNRPWWRFIAPRRVGRSTLKKHFELKELAGKIIFYSPVFFNRSNVYVKSERKLTHGDFKVLVNERPLKKVCLLRDGDVISLVPNSSRPVPKHRFTFYAVKKNTYTAKSKKERKPHTTG